MVGDASRIDERGEQAAEERRRQSGPRGRGRRRELVDRLGNREEAPPIREEGRAAR